MISRRRFLGSGLAAAALPVLAKAAAPAEATVRDFTLTSASTSVPLVGGEWPATEVWAYNRSIPGPEIRVRQGELLRVVARNGLAEPTTIHWHGVRLPIEMDGVPGVTQEPIGPGGVFRYEFEAVDAGTFWYHPHFNSSEQVERGLSGVLVVEEREPIRVDREVTWVIDDWLLRETAQIDGGFGHRGHMSHGGRLGNTVTVNGRIPDSVTVRAGERIRLRLANVSNARTFSLDFGGLDPKIVALDGQPVAPHAPDGGRVTIAAAQRVDLVLDMAGRPGDRQTVTDGYYRGQTYEFLDIVYSDERPLRDSPLDAPVALPHNPVPEPVPDGDAMRQTVVLQGGAMGAFPDGADRFIEDNQFWFVNGLPHKGRDGPLFTVGRGRTCVVTIRNETRWEHPMHLHGFSFRVLGRNGKPNMRREVRDTVLVPPEESAEVAFVADNPGDWMFHCHILEHQVAGMMGIVKVA